MPQHIGTCNLCGGSVTGYRGAWHCLLPPPPDTCSRCGAVRDDGTVIPMRPRSLVAQQWRMVTTNHTTTDTGSAHGGR